MSRTESRPASCCGSPLQVITLRTRDGVLDLLRCGACEAQVWARDGVAVDRSAAFDVLAGAFGSSARAVHAQREQAAAAMATRAADRAAAASRRTAPEAAHAGGDVIDLLAGWRVLGSDSRADESVSA